MNKQDLQLIAARRGFDDADLIAYVLDDNCQLRRDAKEVAATIRECLQILELRHVG